MENEWLMWWLIPLHVYEMKSCAVGSQQHTWHQRTTPKRKFIDSTQHTFHSLSERVSFVLMYAYHFSAGPNCKNKCLLLWLMLISLFISWIYIIKEGIVSKLLSWLEWGIRCGESCFHVFSLVIWIVYGFSILSSQSFNYWTSLSVFKLCLVMQLANLFFI